MLEKNSCQCDHPAQAKTETVSGERAATVAPHGAERLLTLKIHHMDCPTEEKLIRLSLASLPGIIQLDFDLLNRLLTVHHKMDDTGPVLKKLTEIGMVGQVIAGTDAGTANHIDQRELEPAAFSRKQLILMAIAGTAAFFSEFLAWASGDESSWQVIALACLAILTGGIPTLKKGWIALRHFNLNIYLLMTTAVIGALTIGQWPEAAVVIWLFGVAEMIEAASLDRARHAISSLVVHAPDSAIVLQADQQWQMTPLREIAVGQTLRIRAGERIALDGIVQSGHSSVDQSPITGESMPQEKSVGDVVYAGTLNQSGTLEILSTSSHTDTMLSRIARSVQQAQSQRAPTQSFVDQFASLYTPAVFIIAILIAIVPPVLAYASWHSSIYQALVLLVIACPCALVISTPVTIVSGLALAAKRGILIKGGLYLEQGRKLSIIALDKTGTLTHGKPGLTDIIAIGEMSKQEILRIAASLETGSQHPVAHAVQAAYRGELAQLSKFVSVTASGIIGDIEGKRYYLGNQRMLADLHKTQDFIATTALHMDHQEQVLSLEAQGKTVITLSTTHQLLGIIAVQDTVRASSKIAIQQLHAMGMTLAMLTGDNAQTAMAIAKETGIDDVRSGLLPEDKLAAIAAFSNDGLTGMVGDGVNDAPALARAHIGFAMGAAGSDTALETADVALMQDDLRKLPEFIRISKRTGTILWQNIAFALSVKVVFFVLTLLGESTMWMAVFADTGTSLLVVLNGLRLLHYQDEADSAGATS